MGEAQVGGGTCVVVLVGMPGWDGGGEREQRMGARSE